MPPKKLSLPSESHPLLVPLLLSLLPPSCAGPSPGGEALLLPDIPRKVLGTDRITLGVEVDLQGLSAEARPALETWFFEALAQSPFLDLERGKGWTHRLVLRGEIPREGGGTLTTSYRSGEGAPVPLAAVRPVSRVHLPAALDRLALATRLALGEPRESVREASRPVEALVSRSEMVAAACARARLMVDRKHPENAVRELRKALKRDPNCVYAMALLSSLLVDMGGPSAAEALRWASKVEGIEGRASGRVLHDAKRVGLLATGRYESLVELADLGLEERPRDPRIRFTKALGLCMLGRYEEALPLLEGLRPRLPGDAGVLFCLFHARLAGGRSGEAGELLEELEEVLPPWLMLRLKCLSLLARKKHAELGKLLSESGERKEFRGRAAQLEILGMRASLALLRKEDERAGRLLLEQLDLCRSLPSLLLARPWLLIDAAWVLSRLGRAEECLDLLSALRGEGGFPEAIRTHGIVAYQICRLRTGRKPSEREIGQIPGGREWRHRLRAQRSLMAGKPEEALRLLDLAAETSMDPALLFERVECLTALGRSTEAQALLLETAKALSLPRMDKPENHPLFRSKYAWIGRGILP